MVEADSTSASRIPGSYPTLGVPAQSSRSVRQHGKPRGSLLSSVPLPRGVRRVRELTQTVEQRGPYRRRQLCERGLQTLRLQYGVRRDPLPSRLGEHERESAFVGTVPGAFEETPLPQRLHHHRGRTLRQPEVLGEPGERDGTIRRYVMQQLPLVLAQISVVRPVERAPDPAVQYLELFSR